MQRARLTGWIGVVAAIALTGCSLIGGGECARDAWVNVWIGDALTPAGVTVSAPVTVVEPQVITPAGDRSPATVELDDGSRVRFSYTLPGDDALVLTPGQRVWAELSGHGYFWVDYQVALFTLDGGGPGTLLLAAWSTDGGATAAPGWTLGYEDGDCTLPDDLCGPQVGRDLRVTSPGGGGAALAPGRSADLDGYRVSNGDSGRYESTPGCTDTPLAYYRGGLIRLAGI